MTKGNERRRAAVLERNPQLYRSELSEPVIDAAELQSVEVGHPVSLVGRLMLTDRTGTISKLGIFTRIADQDVIDLEHTESDGGTIRSFLVRNDGNIAYVNENIHVGDLVVLRGRKITPAPTEESVFMADSIKLLSKSLADVYDKNIDFRKRSNMHEHRHVQMLQNPQMVAEFKSYARVYQEVRKFLYATSYDEVSMTLLQETFEAGMAESFRTYVVDREKEMHLRLTAELMLRRLMISGFTKVFEIGKSYRNQGAVQTMHPEFTILELYRAYAREGEMEALLEAMLRHVLIVIHGKATIPTDTGVIDCSRPWRVVDFGEEMLRLAGMPYDEHQAPEVNATLLDRMGRPRPSVLNAYTVGTELYCHLISLYTEPTFLKGLPAATSPLNKQRDDGSTIDETLLVINRMLVADVVNAERDPAVLRTQMEQQLQYRDEKAGGNRVNESLLSAMRYGMPPSRGVGMGMERLLMLIFNKTELREVEFFPVF